MLRKRNRSVQKDQHQMSSNLTQSEANSENCSQTHHALGRNNVKGHSIFNVPGVYMGLGPNGLLDSDSVRSPTSPLEARARSNQGNPVRRPRPSPVEGNQRSWDSCKVGLGIVESLEDCSRFPGKILQSPKSKRISLSPQMMIKAPNWHINRDSLEGSKSLPKDFCKAPQNGSGIHKGTEYESLVLFEIGESGQEHHEMSGRTRSSSFDSCCPLMSLSGVTPSFCDSDIDCFAMKDVNIQVTSPHFIGGSLNSNAFFPSTMFDSNTLPLCCSNEFIKSLLATEIENSEDYTCVISHGPNPKTTHIFGDCILETHSNAFKNPFKNEEKEKEVNPVGNNRLGSPKPYPSSDFLSFCHHCNKKLQEGEDIYIYGGEKAFCTLTCRAMEIMIDEELENSNTNPCSEESAKPKFGEQLFGTGILTAT